MHKSFGKQPHGNATSPWHYDGSYRNRLSDCEVNGTNLDSHCGFRVGDVEPMDSTNKNLVCSLSAEFNFPSNRISTVGFTKYCQCDQIKEWDGRSMWHACERSETHTKLWSERKKTLGWHRRTWEDNVRMDETDIGWGGVEWIHLAQD
jgi:hypothetical protein